MPYLPSSLKPLTRAGLAREAADPALARELTQWRYVAGSDRYFQGESRQLELVDARTLVFGSAAGASAFVGFVRGHAAAYLGAFPQVRSYYVPPGRRGIVATAQECQCHLANPAYLAVVARGQTVTWLEIDGPRATLTRLGKLIARAP